MEYLPALYSSGCESRSPVVLREAYPVDAAEGPGRVSAPKSDIQNIFSSQPYICGVFREVADRPVGASSYLVPKTSKG